jgi:hypothetical protein
VTPIRWLRIGLIAAVMVALYNLSQQMGEVMGNEPVPGVAWSLGALSLVFLLRAAVTERFRGAEADWQKDLLWGLGGGGLLAIVTRWWSVAPG